MRVTSLVVENIKRVRQVIITPPGWLVKIAGKNKQGKSSTLDALMYLIEGQKNIPSDVIREGESKGKITADIGGLRITRTFTPKGTRLTVVDSQGLEQGQNFINNLLGSNTTDAMQFLSKKPAEQKKLLAAVAKVDTAELDRKSAIAYNERTEIGRDVTRLKGQFESLKFNPGVPAEEVQAADLLVQLDEARTHNKEIDDAKRSKGVSEQNITSIEAEIENLKARLEENRKNLEAINHFLSSSLPIPTDELLEEVNQVDATNQKVRENKSYLHVKEQYESRISEYQAKTALIDQCAKDKTEMLKNADFPIPGLSLGDDCVLYNGHPLEEASGAEQIIVGIAIASRLIPQDGIRALRVKNGSLLDEESMDTVKRMAEKEGVQVWVEVVMSSPEHGDGSEVYIEDGEVAAAPAF